MYQRWRGASEKHFGGLNWLHREVFSSRISWYIFSVELMARAAAREVFFATSGLLPRIPWFDTRLRSR
jgi:hypothetical protein